MTTAYPDSPYGVAILLDFFSSYEVQQSVVNQCAALPVAWVKLIFSWSRVELSPGTYTWPAGLDITIQRFNAAGINVQFDITAPPTWHKTQPWGTNGGKTYYYAPGADMAAFAVAVATRYQTGSSNGVISAIQIGNEDYDSLGEVGGKSANAYMLNGGWAADALVLSYAAIKAIDANMLVCAGAHLRPGVAAVQTWQHQLNTGGGVGGNIGSGPYRDITACDFYAGNQKDPNVQYNPNVCTIAEFLADIHNQDALDGLATMDLRLTEVGYAAVASPGPNSKLITYAQQEQYGMEVVQAAYNEPACSHIFLYTMDYADDNSLVLSPTSVTPLYTAYQAFIAQHPQWTQPSSNGSLPGQKIINGVSNYLWGTNQPDYNETLVNNTGVQAQLKANGITIIRCPVEIWNGTTHVNCTDAQLDALALACENVGAQMLCILRESDLTFSQHVVSHLGNRCNLYEFSNEPDLNGISWQTYLNDWNTLIPACRTLNPAAAFIGPALGAFSNVQNYLVPWLQGCVTSGVLPDGVSWHDYPCTSSSSIPQATCLARAPNIGGDGASLRATVAGIVGKQLPVCLTEWNIDAYYGNSQHQSYSPNTSGNAAFISSFTASAMDGLVANTIDMACEFELNAYLINDSAPSTSEPQLQTMYAEEVKYLGSGGQGAESTDTFVRPDQSYWSPASDGETWTQTGTGAIGVSVHEGELLSTGSDTIEQLGTTTLANLDVYARMGVSLAGDTVGLVARLTISGGVATCYDLLWYSGALHIVKTISGTKTVLASVSYSMTPGFPNFSQFHFHLNGTTLSGSIWLDGTAEPTAYMVTATDSAIATGGYGVLGNTATSSPYVLVDHFSAGSAAPQASVTPSSLTFSAASGGPNPAAQSVQLTNTGAGTGTYSTTIVYSGTGGWLSTTNPAGVLFPGASVTETYSVAVGNLPAGSYSATVTLAFLSGSSATLHITLAVSGGGSGGGTYDQLILATVPPPIAYYRLNESSGAIAHDTSGNGYDAVVIGATPGATGLVVGPDTCMTFLPSGSLILPNSLQYWTWTAFTAEYWTNLGTGTHYIAVTVQGGTTTLCLDGVIVSSVKGGPVFVGGLLDYLGSFATAGRMAKVAFYQGALTPSQLLAHYLAGISIPPPPVYASSGSIMDLHYQKIQQVKIYDPFGNYLGIWSDAPLLTGLKDTINACQSPIKMVLPRKIDAFDGSSQSPEIINPGSVWGGFKYGQGKWGQGPSVQSVGAGNTVVLGNQVRVYLYGPGLPATGLLKYQGYIDTIEPTITDRNAESVTVTITPFNAAIADHGYGGVLTFTAVDPVALFNYWFTNNDPIAGGGVPYINPLVLATGSATASGTSVTYTVQSLNLKSIFDTCMLMLGGDWYWRPNSDNTVYLGQLNTTADHTIILGQHISSLSFPQDNTQRKNIIYFIGGTNNTITAHAVGPSSLPPGQGGIGARLKMLQDARITDTPTAQVIANAQLALYDQVFVRAKCRLMDYRGDTRTQLGVDIESYHVGDTVIIRDGRDRSNPTQWGNFAWGKAQYGVSSGSIFNMVAPIVSITYGWHYIDLELGSLAPSQDRALFTLEKRLQDYTLGQ